jgi:hypothetical protein
VPDGSLEDVSVNVFTSVLLNRPCNGSPCDVSYTFCQPSCSLELRNTIQWRRYADRLYNHETLVVSDLESNWIEIGAACESAESGRKNTRTICTTIKGALSFDPIQRERSNTRLGPAKKHFAYLDTCLVRRCKQCDCKIERISQAL